MLIYEIMVPYTMGSHNYVAGKGIPRPNRNIHVPYHQDWDKKVIEIAGGMTLMRAAKGTWISPTGTEHKEIMIPVRISCTEEQIEEIIELTLRHYCQEAVMAYVVSEKVIVRYAK